MPQPQPPASSITLETVKKQFKNWRDNRKNKSRIPNELWEAAASLSGQYSIHCISKALGVNHSALRDRIAARSIRKNTEVQTCFLELPQLQSPPTSSCLVEMENCYGDKMRMHFAEANYHEILALGQNFWERDS